MGKEAAGGVSASVGAAVGAVAIALVAALAAAVALGAGRQAYGAVSEQTGFAAYQEAQALPKGAARDEALHQAQAALRRAVAISPVNADAWLALAGTRYLQAAEGAAGGVSLELAAAAAEAAAQAFALQPLSAEAAGRLAQARALAQHPADTIAQPLAVSYQLAAQDWAMAAWRPAAAFQAWPYLPLSTRDAALIEACFFSRETPDRFQALAQTAAAAADPDLRARLAGLLTDAACQPQRFAAEEPRPAN